MFDFAALTQAVRNYGHVARIVLVDVKGSTPRSVGTSMLVWKDGISGTIGGGNLEMFAITSARNVLSKSIKSKVERQTLGPNLNQCCGGAVTFVIECFTISGIDHLASVQDTFVRPIASPMPEQPDILTRKIDRAKTAGSPPSLGWVDGWLAEPMWQKQTPIAIHGAGHVGRALTQVLAPMPEYQITLSDPRPHQLVDLPNNIQICTDACETISNASHDTCHFVMTPEHDLDLALCHQILSRPFAFAGLIGSATKWARFRTRLAALGHAKDEINRITCPIGDPALGKHPQAIALGVATTLLKQPIV